MLPELRKSIARGSEIEWPATVVAINALNAPPAIVLELSAKLADEPTELPERIRRAIKLVDRASKVFAPAASTILATFSVVRCYRVSVSKP
jgi:hypothetical protein